MRFATLDGGWQRFLVASWVWEGGDASSPGHWACKLIEVRVDFDGVPRTSGCETLETEESRVVLAIHLEGHLTRPSAHRQARTHSSDRADKRRRRAARNEPGG